MDLDITIVGAGPVGLCLALGLANHGKKVLLLEKKPWFDEHSRAPAIWPRTQEVLAQLGVLNPFLQKGIVLQDATFWEVHEKRERALIHLPFKDLKGETPYPQMLIFPQNKTERLLHEVLSRNANVNIQMNSEVTFLEQNDHSVIVHYQQEKQKNQAESSFVVGCDGAHSKIRELLGFQLKGITYPIHAALADITTDLPFSFPRLSTREFLAVAIKMETNLWRIILPFPKKDKLPLDQRIEQSIHYLFGQIPHDRVWQSEFTLHQRISEGLFQGRVCLAGDAAHLNSPVGGQGMNAGIQDTEILCRCLVEALDNKSTEPVHLYAQKRRIEIQRGVNRFTHQLTRILIWRQGKYLTWILRLVNLLIQIKPLRLALLRRMAMLKT